MKITELIEQLDTIKAKYGDIEVTCTASTLPDGPPNGLSNVWESTVETTAVHVGDDSRIGPRVRLWM